MSLTPRRRSYEQAVQIALDNLAKHVEATEKFGEDDYPNGATVVFDLKFNETGVTYNYAARKACGIWYITCGSRGTVRGPFAWDDLIEMIKHHCVRFGYVTELAMLFDTEE